MAKRTAPPKGTTVIFVRHGRTPTTGQVLPGRAKGLHLSEEGQRQAEDAATRIAEGFASVDAIYASPLERTRETAAPIAKALGLKVKAHRGLLECDFGEWTGAKLKDLAKLPEWFQVQNHPSGFRFPGGESFLEMQARLENAIGSIIADHRGGTVVLVSHADPIKTAISTAMGTSLDLFQRISISPCSISVVQYGVMPSVLAVNTTDLRGLQPS